MDAKLAIIITLAIYVPLFSYLFYRLGKVKESGRWMREAKESMDRLRLRMNHQIEQDLPLDMSKLWSDAFMELVRKG